MNHVPQCSQPVTKQGRDTRIRRLLTSDCTQRPPTSPTKTFLKLRCCQRLLLPCLPVFAFFLHRGQISTVVSLNTPVPSISPFQTFPQQMIFLDHWSCLVGDYVYLSSLSLVLCLFLPSAFAYCSGCYSRRLFIFVQIIE